MSDDRTTKVIGRQEYPSDYDNLYKDAMAHEVDELAFLDEMPPGQNSRAWRESNYTQPRDEWSQGGSNVNDGNWRQGEQWQPDEYDEYEDSEPDYRGPEGPRGGKKKKKSKAGLIIGIIVVLIALGAAGAWFFMSGSDPEEEPQPQTEAETINIDLGETVRTPEVTGYEGEGVLGEILLDQDKAETIIESVTNDEQQAKVRIFFENVEYTADKTEGLKTGDEITITADYDEVIAKDAGIVITNGTYHYTVDKMEAKKAAISMPQWFRCIEEDGDELIITCIVIAKKGTVADLPISFMYAREGGAFSDVIDTSGSPAITYKGVDYYMEPGCESPFGPVSSLSDDNIQFSMQQMGDKFSIDIDYKVNDDGTITVERASGGDAPIPIGTYEPISSKQAKKLGGSLH